MKLHPPPAARFASCATCLSIAFAIVGSSIVGEGIVGSGILGNGIFGNSRAFAQAPAKADVYFREHVQPFLRSYCLDCHDSSSDESDIVLDTQTSASDVNDDYQTWEKVVRMLQTGDMPPEDAEQPEAAERVRISQWLRDELDNYDCSAVQNPGRVTARRLNREEYKNTIRDLVGIDFQGVQDFPSDDVGYGFDNIGDVLSLSTLLMEKYMAASEVITREAIVTDTGVQVPVNRHRAVVLRAPGEERSRGAKNEHVINGFYPLHTSGELYIGRRFRDSGKYIIRVRAFAKQAGDEPVKMAIRLDKKDQKVFDVHASSEAPEVFEVSLTIPSGGHRTSVAFLNGLNESEHADTDGANGDDADTDDAGTCDGDSGDGDTDNADTDRVGSDGDAPDKSERSLWVEYIEIKGPLFEGSRKLPESHRRILFCEPEANATPEGERECAEKIMRRFATRAFRRPVRENELVGLLNIYDLVRGDGGNFPRGIQLAVQTVLVSPSFLFRFEKDPAPTPPGQIRTLDEYELATRLSYFLWSSMPDDELFALADSGTLRNNLDAQVRRMLADKKAQAFVENFGAQWLTLRNLDIAAPDPESFPDANSLLKDMRQETLLFFEKIMQEDRSVLEFLDSDFAMLNEPLAKFYGIEGVTGDRFRSVSVLGTPRGGVLTQASILTITSNPNRTSPVKRGKWVLEQILNTPPPPPPPNVEQLPEDEESVKSGSLRQRLQAHQNNPMCSTCHARMDPLGFGLENFNAVGQWREKDINGFVIDSTGTLPDGASFNGPVELKSVLLEKKELFCRALCEKILTYALGRGMERYDRCAIDAVHQSLVDGDYRFSSLVLGIVHSDPFQMRGGPGGEK